MFPRNARTERRDKTASVTVITIDDTEINVMFSNRLASLERRMEHFDVLIMGAGLSGIDAAHHLQKMCPNKSYVILEQRARIGGTWDLFRYPGIRSDSDMLTMGYSFRPWTHPKTISPGDADSRIHHRNGAR